MAEPTDPRRPVAHVPAAISRVLTGLAQCLKWLILSLMFSVLIEWIGMVFWWEEQGLDHSRQMLVNELQFLGADFHRSWLTAHPMQFASDLSDRFYTISPLSGPVLSILSSGLRRFPQALKSPAYARCCTGFTGRLLTMSWPVCKSRRFLR
jgi:integrating conjugative element membrane protein (TIGR03747 family)